MGKPVARPEKSASRGSRSRASWVRPLLREVGWVVAIKLVALLVLWMAFFRGAPRTVSAEALADQLLPREVGGSGSPSRE